MSEQVNNSQKTVVMALIAIAVLLVAIIGVIVVQGQSSNIPTPVTGDQGTPDGAQGGMPGGAPATVPSVDFDVATATKVPAGVEPEQFVRNYYELCSQKKYDEAYTMLPLATQQYYGDAEKFKGTLESYGITEFEVESASGTDTEVKVVGVQQAQGMAFAYTWTMVKEGDAWYVKSREMGGQ